ncbi:hypothetical protein [Bradyrhizobium sp. CCBAU 51745]|uniref:hypothetical protein n=1 Tax=Bradyrhizobium sp. CCBAU 51745 TaxID=1325099 RepID=UPI002306A5F0|nr:hypothetical protein [Bradyrhizobium sp. CCBAU 51745]
MAIDHAQSLKPDEDRTKVAADAARAVHTQPSNVNFAETETCAEDGSHYLPGKWSWGPAKSSFEW